MAFLSPSVWAAILVAAALGFAGGWFKGGETARTDLAVFQADVKAKGDAKGAENADLQAKARRAAAQSSVDAAFAIAAAERTRVERDEALRRMGGIVRDRDDARRVLAAGRGSSAAAVNPPASLRSDAADSRPDSTGRLEACRADLTVLTDTLSTNMTNHERALIARDACVRQYNEVRALYNEASDGR